MEGLTAGDHSPPGDPSLGKAILTTSEEVRNRLIEALRLDLVGPWSNHAFAQEMLRGWERPSNRYLTGFLVPTGMPPDMKSDVDEDDELGEIPETAGLPEEGTEDRRAAKKGFFPSSMGVSFLVDAQTNELAVTARWGDYALVEIPGPDGTPSPGRGTRDVGKMSTYSAQELST